MEELKTRDESTLQADATKRRDVVCGKERRGLIAR